MSQEYKLSDEVLMRIVQIVQEGMLMGCDVVDIMRMIRVEPDTKVPGQVCLTKLYKEQVETMHAKWLDNVALLQEEQEVAEQSEANVDGTKLIFN